MKIILVILFLLGAYSRADVICPCYGPETALKAIAACPSGQETRLWLVINPNSGPGLKKDPKVAEALAGANKKKIKVLFYIDLIAFPGDGITPMGTKEGYKKVSQLLDERELYSKHYGNHKWDGWFFDDASSKADSINSLDTWPGEIFLNAGAQYTPKSKRAIVVISESKGTWPRKLTEWERGNISRCAVIGLAITKIDEFIRSTSGIGYRMAYGSDDDWKAGKTPYDKLSPYFREMF